MLESDFRTLPHFSPNEKWGDLSKVHFRHVAELQLIRFKLIQKGFDWPMVIHCCFDLFGHKPGSYHFQGLATDFHFKCNRNIYSQSEILIDALKEANLYEVCGLGIYPDWVNPGFHYDSRGDKARWKRRGDKYDRWIY